MNAASALFLLSLSLIQSRSDTELTRAWDSVTNLIRENYYARQTRRHDMERLLAAYGPSVREATSREQFGRTVNKMIAEFGDSHFGFFTKADQGYYVLDCIGNRQPQKMPQIGAWFKETPQGYSVGMVLEASPAAHAGLRKGDVVESIDGAPFAPVASLTDKVGREAVFKVKRAEESFSVRLAVQELSAAAAFLQATRASERVIAVGDRKFGYIHLWTMMNDDFRRALDEAVYGMFFDTDGIILDLRDGYGGSPDGFFTAFFLPEIHMEWDNGSKKTKSILGYSRPLVVLINGGTRSAKEEVSFVLQKAKRAVLVGKRTAGHVLGTWPMHVSDWGFLEIPFMDLKTDGVRLEGAGVKPDVAVPTEYDENGEDLILGAGIKELAKQVADRKAA